MVLHRHDPIARQLEALGLRRPAAQRLSRHGTLVHLADGATLCTEGERGLQAFVLLDGEARVLTAERVIDLGPGSVVGELATVDRSRTRNATVVTHGEADVLVYDARTFQDLAEDPALRPHLLPARAAA